MTASRFEVDGFETVEGILSVAQCEILAGRTAVGAGAAGNRALLAQPWCSELARSLRHHPHLCRHIPSGHVAVQCTFFEKSAGHNWLVPLHQDLSIPVAGRVEGTALRGWSEKEGMLFVQAPPQTLAQIVAARLHLDDCGEDDGPLRVVPASHAHGVLSDEDARALRKAAGETVCVAGQGDVLLLRPLLLHASSKGAGRSRRRVLHFVFAPSALPHGLRWSLTV